MLENTLTIPRTSGDITVTRIDDSNKYESEYSLMSSTSEVLLKIRHTTTKAGYERHNVDCTETVFATATEEEYYKKDYWVSERKRGDLTTDNSSGILGMLQAVGFLDRLMAKES